MTAQQNSEHDSAPPRRVSPRGVLTGVIALAMIGGVVLFGPHTAGIGGGPPPGAMAPPTVTIAHPLERDVIEWAEYTGQFEAVEYVELRARVNGYLTEIHFKDGQAVNKGDLLFVIDPRPFEADLAQATANLERDKAQLLRANQDLKRYAELSKKDFATHQQYDNARAAADGAAATVKADEAAVDQARLNLEFTHITAPVKGRIGSHQVSVGNLVVGGAGGTTTLLTTIISLDPIHFAFDVSEADQLAYKRGVAAGKLRSARDSIVPIQARLVDETRWAHDGQIDFVDNQLNRGAGTLHLRALFPNPDQLLVPGQFARARVPASEPHIVLLVPDSAIVTDQSRKLLLVVTEGGTVEPRMVKLGPTAEGLRIVRSGVSATDSIIIDGLMRARPGTKVTPQQGAITPVPGAD